MRPKSNLYILIVLSFVLLIGSIPFSETIAQTNNSSQNSDTGVIAGNFLGNQINSVGGGPGFVTVSGYDFVQGNTDDLVGRSGATLFNPGDSTISYHAPLNLPNGATIKKIVIFVYDAVTPADLTVRLDRGDLGQRAWSDMAITTSSGSLGYNWSQGDVYRYEVVDLQNNFYYLTAVIPGGNLSYLSLWAVRVDYEYPGYIPLVTK